MEQKMKTDSLYEQMVCIVKKHDYWSKGNDCKKYPVGKYTVPLTILYIVINCKSFRRSDKGVRSNCSFCVKRTINLPTVVTKLVSVKFN